MASTRISVLALLISFSTAFAVGARADDSVISVGGVSVGGGAAALNPGGPGGGIEGYFRVHFSGANIATGPQSDLYMRIVIGRFNGEVTNGASGPNYLDVSLDTVGLEVVQKLENGGFESLTGVALAGNVQRNIQLGNNIYASLSLLGLRGAIQADANPYLTFFANASGDILGLGLIQTLQNEMVSGLTFGGAIQAGLVIAKRIRITLGEQFQYFMGGNEVDKDLGTQTCTEQYDSYYDEYYQNCTENYKAISGDWRDLSNTSLELEIQLVNHLSIFGRANYNLYRADIMRNEVQVGSTQSAFQFFFGVEGSL